MLLATVAGAPFDNKKHDPADDSECCHCCCLEEFENGVDPLGMPVIQELKMIPADHVHHEPGKHPKN